MNALAKGRLLQRSIVTIKDLRANTGADAEPTLSDAVVLLQATAATIDTLADDAIQLVLLDAADIIRRLSDYNAKYYPAKG
jgi:hypothetical protein